MKTTVEWTPVTDRLPSLEGKLDGECEYVLVAVDHAYVTIAAYEEDGWSSWDNFGHYNPARFTHWAPLPEPPKEQK